MTRNRRVAEAHRLTLPSSRGPSLERRQRAIQSARPRGAGPAQGRGKAPAIRDQWTREVGLFVSVWQRRRAIGDRWAKGLHYILGRIPRLLSRTTPLPPLGRSADVREEHVTALRDHPGWQRATTGFYFAALRQFLRWSGNPVADVPEVWRLPPSTAQRRRWITGEQLVRLLRSAKGAARPIVALEGFNGLRRVEVLRLRAADVNLDERWINVHGKGRMGGKWRQIPLSGVARAEIGPFLRDLGPSDRIFPRSASWADQQLVRAAGAAGFTREGFRVSHHDLRRTFGRVAYSAGMDLVQLKNLFGHSNLEMSVHYIGLDLERMREGLSQLDRSLGSLLHPRVQLPTRDTVAQGTTLAFGRSRARAPSRAQV
jgi:integrase